MDKNKIPEGYFERKPEEIINAVNSLHDNIEQEAPILFSIGKTEPYRLPDGYFESFYKNLNIPSEPVVRHLISFRQWAVAASVAAVAFMLWFLVPFNTTQDDSLQLAEVYDYYIENIDQVDQALILDLTEEYADLLDLDLEEDTDSELDIIEETILEEMTDQDFLDIL